MTDSLALSRARMNVLDTQIAYDWLNITVCIITDNCQLFNLVTGFQYRISKEFKLQKGKGLVK